ncbi:MAG: ferrous iron transport protein B [Ignavibacteria bacterium]|nr:ferrous iron transport protein B [Ignavibacteria bacterium]
MCMIDLEIKNSKKQLTVAVAGNPNSGKSTLINAIAGTRLQVGNWSGVTVEKKEASFKHGNLNIRIVDLPGTYSLSPYSQEEVIARNYLINMKPDLIVNVVDATNLERNLYLTVQLLELGIPLLMALNIYDESEKKGYKINVRKIEEMLRIKVVPTIATQKSGLENLLLEIESFASKPKNEILPMLHYNNDLDNSIKNVVEEIKPAYEYLNENKLRWLAIKIIEGDELVLKEFGIKNRNELINQFCGHLIKGHDSDLESLIADARYGIATGLSHEVLEKPKIQKEEITEKIDRIVLNRYLGIPIFLLAMWLMFKLTFDIANPFVDLIDGITAGPMNRWFAFLLASINSPAWFISLVTDGIIAGVGFVLVFVPVIFAMMFFITFLEGSGYMARAAFVMDKAMHGIGLHGKSFIPLLLGFGCNVPSIYATRTLENEKDKILTSLIVPFMSCGARLPVYVIFSSAFFPGNGGFILWLLYVIGIGVAVVSGLIFKKTLFKGENSLFIMELPPYRMPTMKSLMIHTWEKGKHFLVKAGTYILAVSIFIWFLLNLPWGVENKKDSFLGIAGQVAAPVLEPIGFGNWEAASALITGVIAKEIVVGTMAEIYVDNLDEPEKEELSFGNDIKEIGIGFYDAVKSAGINISSTFSIATITAEEDSGLSTLKGVIQTKFTPLAAISFMIFVLLYMPCIITGVAYKQEFGTWKWYGISLINGFGAAWILSLIVYQGGLLLGFGG